MNYYKPEAGTLQSRPLALPLRLLQLLLVLLPVAAGGAEKTLIYCPAQAPRTFNPQLAIDPASFDASSRVVYDRLVEFAPGATEVVPGLAEGWEVTDNGRVYTFYLRPDVQFHRTPGFTPGRPFNADDVLFSFTRQWRKNHPYHDVSGTRYDYFEGMGVARLVLAVDKLDDLVVQFSLKQPQASFPAMLAMDFASILSAEYGELLLREGLPQQLDRRPVGTGPFQYAGEDVGVDGAERLRYQAHPDYWAGRPALDQLLFDVTPDFDQRVAKLNRAECHLLPPLSRAEALRFKPRRGVALLQKPAFDLAYLAFNSQRPPLDDPRVRRALALAVDRRALVEAVYRGTGRLAQQPLPPTSWAYPPEENADADFPAAPAHDPAQARALLAEVGVDGLQIELWPLPVERDYLPDAAKAAQMIQADWADIGVETHIVELKWEEFLARSRRGEHQAMLLGWVGDNGDPDNFLAPLLSCTQVGRSNRAQWCDSEFEALLRQGRIETDLDQRRAIYGQALRRFHQETPWLVLAHSLRFQPLRRGLSGFQMGTFGDTRFYGVDFR